MQRALQHDSLQPSQGWSADTLHDCMLLKRTDERAYAGTLSRRSWHELQDRDLNTVSSVGLLDNMALYHLHPHYIID